MPETVLAIDPGERVGWAHGVLDDSSFEVTGQGVTPLRPFALKLEEVWPNYDTVVYESWRLYPTAGKTMIGNDMQPSQLVGMIRFIGWHHQPQVGMVVQPAKIKDTALKTMPEWLHERMKLSTEQHDQDALMHLWHYYWKTYIAKEAI